MHGRKSKTLSSLNELRFLLATTTDKRASVLPPTVDAIEQHVLRAQYQVAVWCQSNIAKPVDMDPVGHGWHMDVKDELCPTCTRTNQHICNVQTKVLVDRNASVSLLDLTALTFVTLVDNVRTSMRQV